MSFRKDECPWIQARFEICEDWNALASVTDIRNLIGLVGSYQRFIKGFSKITKPMIELLRKDKKFKWMPTCEASF
jgi:hypothetical protein